MSTDTKVEEWYDKYGESVFSFILMMVRDYQLAEDLTQETFIKAYRKFHTFSEHSSLKTWIFSIAHNTTKDHFRKSNPLKHYLNLSFDERDLSLLPHQLFELNEQEAVLYQALHKLKPSYRKVIILRKIKEFSTIETAVVLGWSESKVKSTLRRGMTELKTILVKGGFEYEAIVR